MVAKQTFKISRYPITVNQYRSFIDDGGYDSDEYWRNIQVGLFWRNEKNIRTPKEYDKPFDIANHPQIGVSWFEAIAFCNWLSQKIGKVISLPTESQWERAARGTKGRKLPWGDEIDFKKCNCEETGIGTTTAVGIFPEGSALESGKSICDLTGNVWEWCLTKWQNDYLGYQKDVDEALSGKENRVLRGGSFLNNLVSITSASRYGSIPSHRSYNVGFRIATSS